MTFAAVSLVSLYFFTSGYLSQQLVAFVKLYYRMFFTMLQCICAYSTQEKCAQKTEADDPFDMFVGPNERFVLNFK